MSPTVALTPEIEALLNANAPVAIGVSGGKDSVACAEATVDFLDCWGHQGPRLLIHSDLIEVEWRDSYPSCQRVAAHLNTELQVVTRKAGGMMTRWETRWESSVRRYLALECVKVILPWSTPSMRFCTSELKRDPIFSHLKKRWPKQAMISVTGIRAEESPNRAKMPVAKPQALLPKGSYDWNPIIHWTKAEVFAKIAEAGLELHEAYTKFGSSRVSCVFCIMGAQADLHAALSDPRNRDIYERMCKLEAQSGFGFQSKWLMELDPLFAGILEIAKGRATHRKEVESRIPKHLEYSKGWPTCIPTQEEAELLARVRWEICALYGWPKRYCMADDIIARYQELMAAKKVKDAKNK
jgi:3'-phosphoadenosine 5'-phosphosulfate sulfotransferase (PAPS reductase)/FAD synthetase